MAAHRTVRKRAPRVGDTVRLIDPRPIIRFDYAVTASSLEQSVADDESVQAFIRAQRLGDRMANRVIRAVAVSRMLRNRQDGAVRELVMGEPREEMAGQLFLISERAVRSTGSYSRGYRGRDWTGYDDDYEPSSLAVDKTYVCYRLSYHHRENDPRMVARLGPYAFFMRQIRKAAGIAHATDEFWPHYGFWVTKEQVELATGEE